MMPAFTTKDGDSPDAMDTVDTETLATSVDKMIRDGANAIATMGSFGEFHTLLWSEKKKLIEATIAAVRQRVPVFIGCTTFHTRETKREAKFAQEAGADGVLCGVPFYYPSTVENAVQFYHDLADAFPKLGIGIYHNPPLHRITLPVPAFEKLVTRPNIVFSKTVIGLPSNSPSSSKLSKIRSASSSCRRRCIRTCSMALRAAGRFALGWVLRRCFVYATPALLAIGKPLNRSAST